MERSSQRQPDLAWLAAAAQVVDCWQFACDTMTARRLRLAGEE